jgi:hypothetical protein
MGLETITIGSKIHAKCQSCHQFKVAHSQAGHSIEGGMRISFLGGYADYYDPMEEEELVQLDICHDCTNKVLKVLNAYDHEKFHMGHPTERDADPCCDNCWIPVSTGGQWVGTKNPRTGEIKYHRDENGNYIY